MSEATVETPASEIPSPQTQATEFSVELKAQVQTIRSMTMAHNLLCEGSYPYAKFQEVHNTVSFLRSVIERAAEIACQDKDADQVPELKAYKEGKAKDEELKKKVETNGAA